MSLTINGSGGGTPVGTPTIETGSYVGNGTYGSAKPVSISFNRKPVFVWISTQNIAYESGRVAYGEAFFNCTALTTAYISRGWMGDSASSTALHAETAMYAKLDGNTLSWFNASSSYASGANQMNKSGVTYYYFALTI